MRVTRAATRVVLALSATGSLLVTAAWVGGAFRNAHAGPRPDLYLRRSDPGEIRIGDALAVNGQRMQLSAFTTTERPEQVVDFYVEAFRRRGLIPVAAARDQSGHVSVFDPADGLQHFVTVIPERSGHVLVLLGATDPRFTLSRSPRAGRYPVPDEHRAFVGYESQDGPARSESGQFVSRLSAAEVAKFYRARLAARGFVERPESGAGLLAFVNGQEQISVAVQSLETDRGAAVFVARTEGAP